MNQYKKEISHWAKQTSLLSTLEGKTLLLQEVLCSCDVGGYGADGVLGVLHGVGVAGCMDDVVGLAALRYGGVYG